MEQQQQKATTIFINPKFKNAYINPNFFKNPSNTKVQTQIHVNPKFLLLNHPAQGQTQNYQPQPAQQQLQETKVVNNNAIIKNTKRSFVRVPMKIESNSIISKNSIENVQANTKKMNLIKLSNTKLVNASHLMKAQQKENEIIKNATESLIKSKKMIKKSELEESSSIYKLDRRKMSPSIQKKKKRIVSQYSIRKIDASDILTTKKVVVIGREILKPSNANPAISSKNKKLLMVNINGVLYKSTSNKLQKTSQTASQPTNKKLIIRGQKFILDSSGTKLNHDDNTSDMNLSRIDIGGLTYKKASSSSGSYERDNSHHVRNHLTTAKTKSISLLQRTKSQTSNVICPIYRRIGKCLAYANGRCSKIHDQRYVIVCPNFIKGSCKEEKCLLSHNANLHKMPVCKYYLRGACVKSKDECLYLHKKVSDGTKLCPEFLRGYCSMADKCNLLHDHPDFGDKFTLRRYRNPKQGERRTKDEEAPVPTNTPITSSSDARYFDEACSSSSQSTIKNIPKFSKTAPSLPDFIKI